MIKIEDFVPKKAQQHPPHTHPQLTVLMVNEPKLKCKDKGLIRSHSHSGAEPRVRGSRLLLKGGRNMKMGFSGSSHD